MKWLKLAFGVLVTLGFGYWAFRDTNWSEQWDSFRAARVEWLLAFAGLMVAAHFVRTLRWGALLSGIERVRFWPLNQASGIGMTLSLVLPLRLGEFARPYLLSRVSRVKASEAMLTIVLERILDGIFVAVSLRALLFFVESDSKLLPWVRGASTIMFLIFSGGLGFLLFALWQRERAVRLVRATLGRISMKAAELAASVVDNFIGAMRLLPPPRQRLLTLFYTAAFWAVIALSLVVLGRAFSVPLTLFQCSVAVGVLVVGLLIPSGPGSLGTYQAAVLVGLSLFVGPETLHKEGVALANVAWGGSIVVQVAIGLALLATSSAELPALSEAIRQGPPPAEPQ